MELSATYVSNNVHTVDREDKVLYGEVKQCGVGSKFQPDRATLHFDLSFPQCRFYVFYFFSGSIALCMCTFIITVLVLLLCAYQ